METSTYTPIRGRHAGDSARDTDRPWGVADITGGNEFSAGNHSSCNHSNCNDSSCNHSSGNDSSGNRSGGNDSGDADDRPDYISGAFTTLEGLSVTFNGLVDATLSRVERIDARIAALEAERAQVLAHARNQTVDGTLHIADSGATTERALKQLASEVGIATRRHDRTITAQLEDDTKLIDDLPSVTEALRHGEIDARRASVCVGPLSMLATDEHRERYDDLVVELARQHTPGRLKREAKALAASIASVTTQERCKQAHEQRSVWVTDLDDGISELHVVGASPFIHAVHERTTLMARAQLEIDVEKADAVRADEHLAEQQCHEVNDATSFAARTFAQIQSDIAVELLLASDPSELAQRDKTFQSSVTVTIPAISLAHNVEAIAQRHGAGTDLGPINDTAIINNAIAAPRHASGPIDREVARQIAGEAHELVRIITDPYEQQVTAVDARFPTAAMRRFLRTRDAHCRYPGCLRSASQCDCDHTIAREHGGPTALSNLAHLCVRHHKLKHVPGYSVEQSPTGALRWRTPSGQIVESFPTMAHLPGVGTSVEFRPHTSDDALQNGSVRNQSPPNGSAQKPAAQNHAAQKLAAQIHAAQIHAAQNDISQNDTVETDTAQTDTAQINTTQSDTTQIDTIQNGTTETEGTQDHSSENGPANNHVTQNHVMLDQEQQEGLLNGAMERATNDQGSQEPIRGHPASTDSAGPGRRVVWGSRNGHRVRDLIPSRAPTTATEPR